MNVTREARDLAADPPAASANQKGAVTPMTFHSILFDEPAARRPRLTENMPDCFTDLNLDQVVEAITATKKEYNLKPFFYSPLTSVRAVEYRLEVMQDLAADETLRDHINGFAHKMVLSRRYLGLRDKLQFRHHQNGWFLEAADVYCQALSELAEGLSHAELRARGFVAFRAYLTRYVGSEQFRALQAEVDRHRTALATVKYAVLVKDSSVRVRKYEEEVDYSVEVLDTFAKFKQGAAKDYRVRLNEGSGMNHVEGQILDCVARLYPSIFGELERFSAEYAAFQDETIAIFDREIQFYVAYLEHIAPLQQAGLPFCYPRVSASRKEIYASDGFDLALARKLVREGKPIVVNDFHLQGDKRVIIVSGPNQGGKTTFARMFGQLHYLASLGCPVPGREARLFLYDHLLTHFEREEHIQNLRGKLQDDLVRIYQILELATSQSIIVINEIFTSTTASDAALLGERVMARIEQLDCLCVCVTFIDELASLNHKTVSMVSTVVPDNPALRTFKIVRQPADGLAYAISIAEKYQLTYRQLKDRVKL
jgi:DNA mismatch repair protein MutS